MTRMAYILAGLAAVAFVIIFFGFYLPLSRPAATFTAPGRVIARVFEKAHTVGKVGYEMKTGNQIEIGDRYLIDVRLDSGEILRGTWPASQIDGLPVGTRVNVRFQRRVLALFWKRTLVEDVQPLATGAMAPGGNAQ